MKTQTNDDPNPSQVTKVYWIYAERKKGRCPKPLRSGKRLVFVDVRNVDEVWATIKEATVEGRLGGSTKVATQKPNLHATSSDTKVVCVYTYDWTAEEDIKRVREELRKLGITAKLPYKTDEDTLASKYRISEHTRISKYYE